MNEFNSLSCEIISQITTWERILLVLPENIISERKNSQQRSIRQILGHLIDSASNNTHRIIHLQYQQSPLQFPNYAIHGNNDRWIAIQDYQHEDWQNMIQLWKYANFHWVHIVGNIDVTKLDNVWQSDDNKFVSMKEGITGYMHHLRLHLGEIQELMDMN